MHGQFIIIQMRWKLFLKLLMLSNSFLWICELQLFHFQSCTLLIWKYLQIWKSKKFWVSYKSTSERLCTGSFLWSLETFTEGWISSKFKLFYLIWSLLAEPTPIVGTELCPKQSTASAYSTSSSSIASLVNLTFVYHFHFCC